MHPIMLPAFFEFSRTVVSMSSAAIVLLVIGVLAARNDVAQARGVDKVVALSNLFFAMPLAVFGAEHFAAARGIMTLVPKFMPWPLFWTYFVGVGLLAASLSIATKIQVRWSGLLFGIMMFLFVAMMDLPGALAKPHNPFNWVLLLREMSFGSGGWLLAASAMNGSHVQSKRTLITVGRLVIAIAAIFYGVEHFLRQLNVPGVPLEMLMPTWIPARAPISYLTGAILITTGATILLARKRQLAATYLGTWIVLLVVFIYGPILIASMLNPSTDAKVEGLNYFFDTLLYAGTILALAKATHSSTETPA
jgi:uncharacterized membrane protein